MKTRMDVLVVGAGPVGLTMAAELKRYGLSVRIIDEDTARTDKSKAIVIGHGRSSCSTGRLQALPSSSSTPA
jgi:2-polyprenyl-6-methoxyphenol hydroxylase-like FAD-dependent oxidoreductase